MANESFDPSKMPTTPRYGIRYPGATDLVRYASQQFKAMAESIDDKIDTLPASVTARVDQAATQAAASAQTAQAAAATAGTLADQNMAANLNNKDSKTSLALDKVLNNGPRWRNAVIIGDSLCKGHYSSADHDGQGIGDVVCRILGIASVQNVAVSGSGFTVGGTNTFINQWNRVTNKADVDLVLVIGGVNDNNNDCGAACTQLVNAIRTSAANARIYVFPVAGGLGLGLAGHYTALHSINNAIIALPGQHRGVVLMQGCHRWGQMIAESQADGTIHMRKEGYEAWARIAARLMLSGQNVFWPEYARDLNVTSISKDPLFDQIQCKRFIEVNGTITLQIRAHTGRAIDTGFTVFTADKYLCGDITTKYLQCGAGLDSYLTVESGGLKVQMAQLPKDKWVLIESSWIAGM